MPPVRAGKLHDTWSDPTEEFGSLIDFLKSHFSFKQSVGFLSRLYSTLFIRVSFIHVSFTRCSKRPEDKMQRGFNGRSISDEPTI